MTGGAVYLHLSDDRAPDSDVHVFRNMSAAYCLRDGITVYLEGIEFQGGTNAPCYFRNASATGGLKVYAKNCTFKYGGATGGLAIEGADEVISQGCTAARNQNDGLNYHVRNGIVVNAVEINCVGRDNGNYAGNDSDNQGSSMHDAGTVVRVMGDYYRNGGQNVADVGASSTWMLGSLLHHSVATTAGVQANFDESAGTAWLDRVTSSDSTYDLKATSGTIHTREIVSGGNNTGAGTIDTY